jgi:hypothetical protein
MKREFSDWLIRASKLNRTVQQDSKNMKMEVAISQAKLLGSYDLLSLKTICHHEPEAKAKESTTANPDGNQSGANMKNSMPESTA